MVNVKLSALTRRISAVGAVLTVVAASGCGSSSSGLSHSALVSKATAICTKHNNLITAGSQKMLAGGSLPTRQVFGKFVMGTLIPQATAIVNEASALKPGSSDAAAYRTWLANSRTVLTEIKADPTKVQHPSTFTAINNEAKALGLSPACNAGPSR